MIVCDAGEIVDLPMGKMYWLLKLKMQREFLEWLGLGRPYEFLACACLSTVSLNPIRAWELRMLAWVLVTFLYSH